jgi:hypothetical protein
VHSPTGDFPRRWATFAPLLLHPFNASRTVRHIFLFSRSGVSTLVSCTTEHKTYADLSLTAQYEGSPLYLPIFTDYIGLSTTNSSWSPVNPGSGSYFPQTIKSLFLSTPCYSRDHPYFLPVSHNSCVSSFVESMAGPGGGPPRKSHTKSRKGCRICKRRHIRCDETFPQWYPSLRSRSYKIC